MASGTTALSVKGVCLNDAGEVLLCLNARDEWELPGGRPEPGETFERCLEREVDEETGVSIEVSALTDASGVLDVLPGRWVHIVVYGCRVLRRSELIRSAEHQAVRYFAPGDLPGLRLPDVYRGAIDAWRRHASSIGTSPGRDMLGERLEQLSLALELADTADELALAAFRDTGLAVATKADGSPVSDADVAIERALRERLAAARPDHAVVGEEGGAGTGDGRWCWYLDPIDGTSRFIAADPRWYTLIGLVRDDAVMVAVASAPALGRRWWSVRDAGAFCNGKRIAVSQTSTLAQATVNDDWRETLRHGVRDRPLAMIARRCARIRPHDGHSYLAVAQGRGDVAAGTGGGPWDYAAIKLIVEEAGGRFTDLHGHDSFSAGSALVSNAHVHDEARAELTRGHRDRAAQPDATRR